MNKPLEVDFVCICDYASQEASGKSILAGVYPGMISFEREPIAWPQYYLVISISPKIENFEFSIDFVDSRDKNLVSFNVNYENEMTPDEKERIMFIAQIPPVTFTGAGIHKLLVKHKRSILSKREYPVVIGDYLPSRLGKVSAQPKFKLHVMD